MKIEWTVTSQTPMTLKSFLKSKRISKRLLAKVKFQGGRLEVNHQLSRVRKQVSEGDVITLILPDEPVSDVLNRSDKELNILFEDEHFLLVDKPSDIPSVPSSLYGNHTMANRVKGYIERMDYRHKTVHIVTRLDKDTSGVMIFAKHSLAHSYLDQLLKDRRLYKEYLAFVEGKIEKQTALIDRPIGRTEDSIIKRQVIETGKPSKTEYWIKERYQDATQVRIQLHTGRTHQIRVHFLDIGHPLLGDSLYNPETDQTKMQRQALHCSKVIFNHPFTGEKLSVEAPMPVDMISLSERLERVDHEKKT
ncbi:MAG: RluA family pseudouridine synthase [Alkalibacterium sp.]